MSLALRNLLFTVVVPRAGAVWIPWWILTRSRAAPEPVAWPAVAFIAAGAALYLWCFLGLRDRRRRHAGTVGRAAAFRRGGPVPLGPQPHLLRRAPRPARRGLAVPLAAAAGVRRTGGDRLPPVRARIRGADAAASLRCGLHRVPADRPTLDPADAAAPVTRFHFRLAA
jgi:hypothetical protein